MKKIKKLLYIFILSLFSFLPFNKSKITIVDALNYQENLVQTYGSMTATYENDTINLTSTSNLSIMTFEGLEYNDYTLEADFTLTSGKWFGIAYKVIDDNKGIYISKISGESNERAIQTHISGYGTPIVSNQEETGYDDYLKGDVVHVKLSVIDNKISVYSSVNGGNLIQEFNKIPLESSVSGKGKIGFALPKAGVSVSNITIKTDSLELFDTYRGTNTFVNDEGKLMFTGTTSISSIYYKEDIYKYYEMTADINMLNASAGVSTGVVFRTNEDVQGIFLLKAGSNEKNPRAIKYATNTKYSSANTAVKSEDYSSFEIGEEFSVKVRVFKGTTSDLISCWVKTQSDSDYNIVFDSVALDEATYGSEGYVGFFSTKGETTIDNVNIVKLDESSNIISNSAKTFNFFSQKHIENSLNEYFNAGIYTKETSIYLNEDSVKEIASHFHGSVQKDRKTYYKNDALLMGNIDGTFTTINSGYCTVVAENIDQIKSNLPNSKVELGYMAHFKLNADGQTVKYDYVVDKNKVTNETLVDGMKEFYVTLDDMLVDDYFSNWNDTYYQVSGRNDKYLLDFLAFVAPCLEETILDTNYINVDEIVLSVEKEADYLSLKMVLSDTDKGYVSNSNNILAEAKIYIGN